MKKTMHSLLVLAVAVCLAGALGFAQSSGEATYNTNCKSCHGATGTPSAGMAKMGVKPVSDPEIKKLTAAQEFDSVKNGKGKIMKPFSGKLTDAQIKDAVAFYRGLK
jgi:mono/diheme cytochrome c family protein